MKLLQISMCFVMMTYCTSNVPELKPVAEMAKDSLEKLIAEGVIKSGKTVSMSLKTLSVAVPVLGAVDSILNMVEPSEMDQLNDKIDKNHKEIMKRIDNVENLIVHSTDLARKDIKFAEIKNLQAKIKTKIVDEFNSTIFTYVGSESFLDEIIGFINRTEHKNYEGTIVNSLTLDADGDESPLIFVYGAAVRTLDEPFNNQRTSPNRMMYDMYLSMMYLVYKVNAITSYCYSVMDDLKGTDSTLKQNFIKNNVNTYVRHLQEGFDKLTRKTTDEGLSTFLYLDGTNHFELKYYFRTVGYRFEEMPKQYIYTGKIAVIEEGHVITGVRWASSDLTMYLQIQTGKILPNGFIDRNTVSWQNGPNDMSSSRLQFNERGQFNSLMLGDVNFEHAALTGLQFYQRSDGIITFKIFGRKIVSNALETEEISRENSPPSPTEVVCKEKPGINLSKMGEESKNSYTITRKNSFLKPFKFEFSQLTSVIEKAYMYFSGNEVTLPTPIPLSGFGLLHYTNDEEYTGFVKPYLKTLHYQNFLKN